MWGARGCGEEGFFAQMGGRCCPAPCPAPVPRFIGSLLSHRDCRLLMWQLDGSGKDWGSRAVWHTLASTLTRPGKVLTQETLNCPTAHPPPGGVGGKEPRRTSPHSGLWRPLWKVLGHAASTLWAVIPLYFSGACQRLTAILASPRSYPGVVVSFYRLQSVSLGPGTWFIDIGVSRGFCWRNLPFQQRLCS